MSDQRMAAQVERLVRVHGPQAVFKDVSEALPPHVIPGFAARLAAMSEVPDWEAYLRFEKEFASPEVARNLRRGGLRVSIFGLESGSQRLVDDMGKTHRRYRRRAHAAIFRGRWDLEPRFPALRVPARNGPGP